MAYWRYPFWLFLLTANALSVWPQPATISDASDGVYWYPKGPSVEMFCGGSAVPFMIIRGSSAGHSTDTYSGIFWPLAQGLMGNAKAAEATHSPLTEEVIAQQAVYRTLEVIQKTKFVPWKFHHRHSIFEPSMHNQQFISSIKIMQSSCPTNGSFKPQAFFGGDESYAISLVNGTVNINTNSSHGTVWALQTFQQLFYAHSSGQGTYTLHNRISITDQPKWSHRGLSLDIARNVFSPPDVTTVIDAMASVKLNRLHLHATDSQSWPLEIPSLPELATKGAYQSSLKWTAKDLEEVQQYGVLRGVSVYIEIDMPGHTASIAQAYPNLIAAFNEPDWSTFAAEPLSGQLKLNSTAVYDFLETLFTDLLPRIAPFSPLYHCGGDEVNQMVYLLDETVRSNRSEVIQPLLQKFMDFVVDKATAAGLQPVFWEEMLLDWNLTLPNDALIQVWLNTEHIKEVLEKGHRAIFGDYGHWYLDCGYGGFINPYPDGKSPPGIPFNTSGGEPTQIHAPFLDYCQPYKNWRQIYVYDPLDGIPSHQHHLVEGGEVLLWSEQTDHVDLGAKLWPRAAAAAELMWSGPRTADMIEDASIRLGQWRERAVIDHNIRASPVQMTWCLMEGGCTL